MKFIDAQTMRALDHLTIHKAGVPGHVLMDRAGRGLALYIQKCCEALGKPSNASLLMVAGKGNNGGDVFVAARMLGKRHRTRVWLAGREAEVQGDAAWALSILKRTGIMILELPEEASWQPDNLSLPLVDLAVDGLLGTGTKGSPRGAVGAACQYLNLLECPVIAADMPTGLEADRGEVGEICVRADATVTFGAPKCGFLNPASWNVSGAVHLVDIGIPGRFLEEADDGGNGLSMIHEAGVRALFTERERSAHKGHFGRVLIIGASRGLSGAVCLAARAALRGGAGLVSAVVPSAVAPIVAVGCPEAMVHGAEETPQGTLSPGFLEGWKERLSEFDAVLCGPGIGRVPETREIVELLLETVPGTLVLDADALSVFEGDAEALQQAQGPCVITPHPGELATLLGRATADIQADRVQAAREAAERSGAAVVLKGAGTLVAEGEKLSINLCGNPGMATGGSGDVLAGLTVSIAGQGLAAYDAACAAVFLHGRAGDLAVLTKTQPGLVAGDLVEALPLAWR